MISRPRRSAPAPVLAAVAGLLLATCGTESTIGPSAPGASVSSGSVVTDGPSAPGEGPAGGSGSISAGSTDSIAPPTIAASDDTVSAEADDGVDDAVDPGGDTTSLPELTGTTSVPFDGAVLSHPGAPTQTVALAVESWVPDVSTEELRAAVLSILNDDRGWPRAGFTFVDDPGSPFEVILAEGGEVDELCLPLETYGKVSCQNGPVVALNADRWRVGVPHWDGELDGYRGYLVNHEVGHLLGQRHPKPRCPVAGRPAGVMEQQTAGLEGCTGNAWPREWEIERAAVRPVVYAPLPDWGPDPVPSNDEA